jgi:hypothetical protein
MIDKLAAMPRGPDDVAEAQDTEDMVLDVDGGVRCSDYHVKDDLKRSSLNQWRSQDWVPRWAAKGKTLRRTPVAELQCSLQY